MKKWSVVITLILVLGTIFAYNYITMLRYHARVISTTHDYEAYSRISYDGRYDLTTIRHDTESGVFAGFSITARQAGKQVYTCPDIYRVMDLNAIEWMEGTLDVYVDSADVGAHLYRHGKDGWEQTGSEHPLLSGNDPPL